MQFKDYYETLGLTRDATPEDIKRTYRKLARKFHPDVSKEPNAEARFKDIGEAYEVLKDPEKRTAYDTAGSQWERQREGAPPAGAAGSDFQPPPGWDAGFEFSGSGFDNGSGEHSDFFEALFGRAARAQQPRRSSPHVRGADHHAKVLIDLQDAYHGAQRSVSLRVPAVDEHGRSVMRERTLDVSIPKGVREGQHLRLAGQGGAGSGDAGSGDLYLDLAFRPHPLYRVDGRDVYLDVPLAPWEAALGAVVTVPTPDGGVELTVPAGSAAGRKLRLKGRGIPSHPPGDLYVVLVVTLPPADTPAAKQAYESLRAALDFNPRAHLGSAT